MYRDVWNLLHLTSRFYSCCTINVNKELFRLSGLSNNNDVSPFECTGKNKSKGKRADVIYLLYYSFYYCCLMFGWALRLRPPFSPSSPL